MLLAERERVAAGDSSDSARELALAARLDCHVEVADHFAERCVPDSPADDPGALAGQRLARDRDGLRSVERGSEPVPHGHATTRGTRREIDVVTS